MRDDVVRVGSRQQLFLDDHVVDRMDGVGRQVHRPRRHPANPVLKPDRPWEVGGGGTYLYGGTVLFDEEDDLFKMWYRVAEAPVQGRDGQWHQPSGSYRACYAVSVDGINWEKPVLGSREFDGSTANNLLPPAEGGEEQLRRPNLIKDYAEPDARQRYKMLYMDDFGGQWGLSKAYSADGIHWNMNVGDRQVFEQGIAPNGVLFGWDEGNREFVHYHRKGGGNRERVDVDGRSVRRKHAVMRTSSPDFETWGDTTEVLRRGEADPPLWSPSHGMDLAGMQYTEDIYVGVIDTCTAFHVEDQPYDVSAEEWRVYSHMFAEYRTELVYSRDNRNWERLWPGWEFFPRAQWRAWDDKTIGMDRPIVYDDQILWYYCGNNLPLGVNTPDHPLYELQGQVVHGEYMGYSIGVATMRLDGFVSMDGHEPGGTLATRPLVFEGDRLVLNVRAPEKPFGSESSAGGPFARLDVEVLDVAGRPIDGYGAEECDTFTGDDLRHVATWRGNQDLGRLAGTPIRLRFHLRNAALYSFQFKGERDAPGQINLMAPGARGRP